MKKLLKQISDILMSNKGLKVVSLVIAIICWYGIQGVIQSENVIFESQGENGDQPRWRNRTVLPVHCLVDQSLQGRYSAAVEPENVSVEFETREQSSPASISKAITALVDCSHISKTGKYRLPVRCTSPPGIRIVDIRPSRVTLDIEIQEQREVILE